MDFRKTENDKMGPSISTEPTYLALQYSQSLAELPFYYYSFFVPEQQAENFYTFLRFRHEVFPNFKI